MDPQLEIRRLRRALRDLVALSTIPAAWVGREPSAVVAGLADVLVGGFHLDFAYVRLCDPDGGSAVEATRGEAWPGFPEWLQGRLTGEALLLRPEVVPVVGNGDRSFRGVVIPIGVNGERGLVAAACDRAEFPDETDQLLLSVAGNHAATAFQTAGLIEAHRRAEEALSRARDELERRVAERTEELSRTTTEALATQQRFRDLVNSVGGIVWEADAETFAFSFVSEEAQRILGYPTARWLREPTFWRDHVHPDDRDSAVRLGQQASVERRGYESEYRMLAADGRVVWLRDQVVLVVEGGRPARLRGVMVDITERKRADEERQAQRWIMESLDRVNRAIQGTSDLEQMMSDVLEAALEIFGCDRASLVYPCDPDAAWYGVRMHRTRPEFPSIFSVGEQVAMTPDTAEVFRAVRAAGGPLQSGPRSAYPLPGRLGQRLGIQSAIAIALYPKGDQPYVFGLYQCSYPRLWTSQEQFLLEGIGRRLEDALTSLSIFHRLRESEKRYRHIFESTGVSIWEEDFSRVKAAVEELRAGGVRDFGAYFDAHPQFVSDAVKMVRIVDVNIASLKLFGAESKEQLLTSLDQIFVAETDQVFIGQLVAIAEGRTYFEAETALQTLQGERLTVLITITFPAPGDRFASVLVTVIDMTERKQSEAKLEQAQRIGHVGYWDRDLDTDRAVWSNETFRIFGLVPGKSALTSAAVFQLIHPEDQPIVAAAMADARRGAPRFDVEFRVVQPGGEVRVVYSHGDVVKGESGRARRIFGVVHDITDRARAEEALRASEEQWRAVFENNPTTYFMVDAAGTVVSVNPFGAEQLGYTVDELADQPVLKVYHEADREAVQASIARCLHQLGQPFSWELRKVRRDGTVRWVRETARAMRRAGGEPIVLVASEDITEHREAEEDRQERRWVIESMDRVNRAIQATNDLEQMMSDVLDVVLSVFACDRAWLLYPCDPNASFDCVLMERTRPEFPGRFPMGNVAPIHPQSVAVHRIVSESTGPVQFGPGSGQHPLPSELAQRLGVQSRMIMALYPKSAQPYMFGLSQCSRTRVWSPREEFLFQEVGRRLADALTSLLMFRSLRESEERYRSIFDSTGVSIWEEDFSQVKAAIENLRSSGVRDFRGYFDAHPEFVRDAIRMVSIVDVNAASLKLFAAESKEELLVSLPRVFAPETTVFVEELVAIADGRTSFEAEAVVQSLRGERLNVLLTMSLSPSPARFERVLVTLMDVTARKRAEYFTTHVFESAPDQMSILGTDYRFRRVNPVLERFWRLPPGSGAGRHLADVIGVVDFERVKPVLDRCSRGEDTSWVGWRDTIRGRRYTAISFTPLRPDRETVEAILAIARDLTDHMLAIETLHTTQAELAHATRVTTLGELTASIAHEVNQPLAGIVADANASLNWLAASTPDLERVREGLDAIVEGGHRAADVLQRVRQLATKTAPNKSPVNVNTLIDDIVPLVRAQVMANEVSLERQLSDDMPAVLADRIQLQQVLINLVMNAIDAMASVTNRPRKLIIRSGWHDSDHVMVAVQDSGVGLDPDSVDRLFSAFFTTKPGGMGMGLSISRSIVEAHGGRLWATATERHGAIFHFSLPAAP
jgi:PAS domain S-box-containing protein